MTLIFTHLMLVSYYHHACLDIMPISHTLFQWVNYQILNSTSWTVQIEFPSPFNQSLSSLNFLSLDLFIIDCLPGGVYTSVLMWSLIPIAFAVINQFICEVRVMHLKFKLARSNENEEEGDGSRNASASMFNGFGMDNFIDDEQKLKNRIKHVRNSHFFAFLVLIFTLLPPVLRKQFTMLDCFRYHDQTLLRIDTSIDCDSDQYHVFRVFDIMAILVYLTIPMYWMWLLFMNKAVLNPPAAEE
jgi:hypothetical protein